MPGEPEADDSSLVLERGAVRVVLDPAGGRLASLNVDGEELLVGAGELTGLLDWGCYPMVPFGGRLGYGVLRWRGRAYTPAADTPWPTTLGPHAIHGTLLTTAWTTAGPGRLHASLREPWPWPGEVVHEVWIDESPEASAIAQVSCRLTVRTTSPEPMPAIVGWHPWFRRRLTKGAPAQLGFRANAMYQRGDDHLPTGELVTPADGPWDDCFRAVEWPVRISWPGVFTMELTSSCSHCVVFDQPEHALCVEPMTGPPDGFRLGECAEVRPDHPLVATMSVTVRR